MNFIPCLIALLITQNVHREYSSVNDINDIYSREKEGDLTQSYDKTPYTNRKFENQRTTHTNATKNFDYTTIADRLRTVSWSNK